MLVRKNVQRGYQLRAGRIAIVDQQAEKGLGRFQKGFRFLIAVNQDEQRSVGRLVKQCQVQRFRGWRQARNGECSRVAARQVLKKSLKSVLFGG